MLTRLVLKNFTVFEDADFPFAAGLNVIVGENGSGKSHVLKAAYSLAAAMAPGPRESAPSTPTKSYLAGAIARKLQGVFRPEGIGRLASRQKGNHRCEFSASFGRTSAPLKFSFNTRSSSEVALESTPSKWETQPPVYLPTRELLSIYPGFVPLYEKTDLPFEETWRDTCLLLGAPLLKGRRQGEIDELIRPLEDQLGGKVLLENGRFYVKSEAGKLESHLVAEGLRKLAMIAQLIATGSLIGKGCLFWDEPEANLNPKIIKLVARTILQLTGSGIQVFVATHSLFLMRELDILLRLNEFGRSKVQYFSLHRNGARVRVETGDSIDAIGDIDALDEELSQSDRYMDVETAS